ncbi:MAG TPA: hypothetical protein VF744_19310 [Beijerinckiaceae bacterium]|jgi:hypothetical protein
MSTEGDKPNNPMVEVRVERLFKVIEALIQDRLAGPVVDRFKDQVVLIPLDQMESFKQFVEAEIARADKSSASASSAMQKTSAVMPGGFGHCTIR